MFDIHPSTRFARSYKKIPAEILKDFDKKIETFRINPFDKILGTHKLRGNLGDYYSFYLKDGYRVLFEFIELNTVLLINIGKHDSYDKW